MRNSLNDRKIKLSAFEYIKNCKQKFTKYMSSASGLLMHFFTHFFGLFLFFTLFNRLGHVFVVEYAKRLWGWTISSMWNIFFLWNVGIKEWFKFSIHLHKWNVIKLLASIFCLFVLCAERRLIRIALVAVFSLSSEKKTHTKCGRESAWAFIYISEQFSVYEINRSNNDYYDDCLWAMHKSYRIARVPPMFM